MIISHKHKFIFVKTKKVGGTSLEIALSKHCDELDIITQLDKKYEALRAAMGHTGCRNYLTPINEMNYSDVLDYLIRRKRHARYFNHITATNIRRNIGESVWSDYFKFSITRNPFDYIVSRYFWEVRSSGETAPFQKFLFLRPQMLVENRFITSVDGYSAMDFMIRYECFEKDLAAVSERVGLTENIYEPMRQIRARTDLRPKEASASRMFDGFPEGVQLVELLCREELESYGYNFSGGFADKSYIG